LVDAVAFSPDGARVLAGSEDSTGEKMGTHLQGPAAPGVWAYRDGEPDGHHRGGGRRRSTTWQARSRRAIPS